MKNFLRKLQSNHFANPLKLQEKCYSRIISLLSFLQPNCLTMIQYEHYFEISVLFFCFYEFSFQNSKDCKTVGTLLKSNNFIWTSNMQKAHSYGEAICNVGLVFAMPEKLIREPSQYGTQTNG